MPFPHRSSVVGLVVGEGAGLVVGEGVVLVVGEDVGPGVGGPAATVTASVGVFVGSFVGEGVGFCDGLFVGWFVGLFVGLFHLLLFLSRPPRRRGSVLLASSGTAPRVIAQHTASATTSRRICCARPCLCSCSPRQVFFNTVKLSCVWCSSL
jgi:hypothetical protein